MDRVFFAILLPDKSTLKIRFSADSHGNSNIIQHLSISMKQRNLISILMSKPQNIFVNNQKKLVNLIPPELKQHTKETVFFSSSIYSGDQAIGMLYADRYHSHHPITEEEYKIFIKVCSLVSQNIYNLSNEKN